MVPIILLILTLLSAAVSCLALAPRILSTTNTSVNTVVNVSCSDDQLLTTGKMTTVSTCDASGHWTPDVPGCIGTALSIIILWRFCSLPIQHYFIHSGYFYSASSSPILLTGALDYSTDTVSEFHAAAQHK